MRKWGVSNGHWVTHLIWLEPFWILLLGLPIILPGKFLPLRYHPYLLIGIFLFWPLRWIAYGRLSRRSPLDWSIALLLFWLPVNLWASADRPTSWIAAGYLLFGLTLYMALINWPPAQRKPQQVAWLLLLMGGGLAIASPPLTDWKPQFRLFDLPLYDRLQTLPIDLGETIHANILAGALVIVLSIFVSLAIQKNGLKMEADKRRWAQMGIRFFFGVMTLIVGGVIVLTQSRGGYLALAVALPLVFALRWPRLLYGVPVLIVAAILAINRVGLGVVLDQLSSDGALGGWVGRIDIWTQSLNALHDFVFTGIGIGTFTQVLPLLYPLRVSIEGYPHAHNLFLQVGVDLGLPGLIAYLGLLINLFVMLWGSLRTIRAASSADGDASLHWALAAGALGGLVAMLVHGLLDAATWGTKLAFIPWVLFALITTLHGHMAEVRTPPLANKWPKDPKYCHNALVFAPDTTVLEALREIQTMDMALVVPPEYVNFLSTHIQFHFLDEAGMALSTLDRSMFNVIISNTQEIILKRRHQEQSLADQLFRSAAPTYDPGTVYAEYADLYDLDQPADERELTTNQRFEKLRRLTQLGIYVDEAHHAFGKNLARDVGAVKDTRKTSLRLTIDELARCLEVRGTHVVACYNYTGTPYAQDQILPEVVYAYGLKEAIDAAYLKLVRINGYTNVQEVPFIDAAIDFHRRRYR